MIDDQRHAAAPPDAHRFVGRFQERISFRAHVRDISTVQRRHRAGHLDQLSRSRVRAWRIDQRTRHTERAVAHCIAHHSAHGIELRRGWRARCGAHRVDSNRRRAQVRAKVHGDAVMLHRIEPRAEPVRAAEPVHRARHGAVVWRVEREHLVVCRRWCISLTQYFRRHALRNLAYRASVAVDERVRRLALHVDKSRRDDKPSRVDAARTALGIERMGRHDCHDPVTTDSDIRVVPRIAGPVHDSPVDDYNVERTGRFGRRW